MKKIIMILFLGVFGSCSNSSFFNDSESTPTSPNADYIDLQVKIHSTYSLFKALNAGIINQEEYDLLKKNIFGI